MFYDSQCDPSDELQAISNNTSMKSRGYLKIWDQVVERFEDNPGTFEYFVYIMTKFAAWTEEIQMTTWLYMDDLGKNDATRGLVYYISGA